MKPSVRVICGLTSNLSLVPLKMSSITNTRSRDSNSHLHTGKCAFSAASLYFILLAIVGTRTVFPLAYLQNRRGKSSLTERLEEKGRYATASMLDVASAFSFLVGIRSST